MSRVTIVVVVVAVLLLGGFGVWSAMREERTPHNATTTPMLPNPEQPTADDTSTTTTMTLALGETGTWDSISITPLPPVEESRCPTGVECIWEGMVSVMMNIKSGMGESTQSIELGKSVTTEAHEVKLIAVSPHPQEGRTIPAAEYRFVFELKKR